MASKQSALDMNKQYPTPPVEDYVPSSPQYIPDPDMPVQPWHVQPPTPPVFPAQPPTPPVLPAAPPTPPVLPAAPPAPPVLPAAPPAPPASPIPPVNQPSDQLEEGECVDTSEEEEEEEEEEAPADPWNDTAFDLEAKLLNLDEEGFPKENSRRGLVQEISQMHRCIDDTNQKLVQMHISQVNVGRVMGNILDDMKRLEEKMTLDQGVQKKISDISEGIKQVHLSQEAVKEVITDLKDNIEGNPRSQKRTHYQTVAADYLAEDERRNQPKISSEMNFSYFDKQYGEILDVQRKRQLRKGIRTRFVELHKSGKKWELLNYHMQVICKENKVMKTTVGQDVEDYAEREEAYLMIAVLFKVFRRMDLVNEAQPDYKHFQTLLSTIFQGIVEKKISCDMVFYWLSHQMYWALCQQEVYNLELDVLTDVVLLLCIFPRVLFPNMI